MNTKEVTGLAGDSPVDASSSTAGQEDMTPIDGRPTDARQPVLGVVRRLQFTDQASTAGEGSTAAGDGPTNNAYSVGSTGSTAANAGSTPASFGSTPANTGSTSASTDSDAIVQAQMARWNFDFQNEQPLPGRYEWERVSTNEQDDVERIPDTDDTK